MFVDKYLGAYEQRYFGAGHKNTQYEIKETYISENEFATVARLTQNGLWSQKGIDKKSQHLSTVDGIVLAIMTVESYLDFIHEKCSDWLLKAFEVHAASQPIENVDHILVYPDLKKSSLQKKEYELNVSGMKVKLFFEQKEPSQQVLELGPNYYSTHLKNTQHDLQNIHFVSDDVTDGTILRNQTHSRYSGLGSAHAKEVSLLEWLIAFSQLCELMVYNHDKISRENSENLWMRSVKAELDTSKKITSTPIYSVGKVDKAKTISKGNSLWSMLNVRAGTSDGLVNFSAKVAHILPAKVIASQTLVRKAA